MNQLKLLVVDDHPLYREGLLRVMKSLPEVVSCDEAGNGHEAIQRCKDNDYDAVFLDISMPVLDGIETTRHLKKHSPDIKIIILTMFQAKHQIIELIELGVKGYLPKELDREDILLALRHIINGDTFFTQEIKHVWEEYQLQKKSRVQANSFLMFTCREIEVIRFLCSGYSAKDIAEFLEITESTVNNHRSNIMKKMNVDSVVGLVNYAYKYGIAIIR